MCLGAQPSMASSLNLPPSSVQTTLEAPETLAPGSRNPVPWLGQQASHRAAAVGEWGKFLGHKL